jgi:cyclopropane fatty-acyl-phospholipid synthase-like methyltransferase
MDHRSGGVNATSATGGATSSSHISTSINLAFNPSAKHNAETYQFSYDDRSFDLILLKSVFTHMRPAEVDNYLREVSRLLKNDGRCLATFFLLNEEQVKLAREGKNALPFPYGEGVWRTATSTRPRAQLPTMRVTSWNCSTTMAWH